MAADDFFKRWSRKAKAAEEASAAARDEGVAANPAAQDRPLSESNDAAQDRPLPTLEDVERLTPDSDISRFMARGVDEAVKRSALKKLFSDPHFNVMDGLDVYIGDYNRYVPIPPQMLAMLQHAKSLLDPLSELEKPVQPLPQDVLPPLADDAQPVAGEAADCGADAMDKSQEPERLLKPDATNPPEPPGPTDEHKIQGM
jgi:hypothetical protein